MSQITAAMVKELRERTGQGMMDCKKALEEAGGDIEKAIDDMRAAGAIRAAKKAGNIAAEGSVAIKLSEDGKSATIIEVNSQTDFLALQEDFKNFVAESLDIAVAKGYTDAAPLIEECEGAREQLVSKTGENVNIRRLARVEGEVLGSYQHGNRIAAVVCLEGGDEELARDFAMHVAASNPQVVNPEDVAEDVIAKEKEIFIQRNEDKIKGKPENIVENMIKGSLNKFLSEVSLVGQAFVKDPDVTVGKLAEKAGAKIIGFTRYEVGEGIERAEEDFAAEVAAQVAASRK